MKKIYALAFAAIAALGANAQNGAPLYATGDGEGWVNGAWNAATPDEFVYADGKYELKVDGVSMFKISTACGDWDTFNTGCLTCNYGEKPGEAVALAPGDSNINCPAKGDWTITVSGDLSTITLTTEGEVVVKHPWELDLYLRGGMNDWGAPAEWQLTQLGSDSEGNWVYKYLCGEMGIDNGVEFKVADENWNPVNIGSGENSDLVLDENTEAFLASNPANFVMTEDFFGVLYLQINYETNEGHIYLSNDDTAECPYAYGAQSVKTLDSENAAAVYYNLQGVRVANAENGIFIVKKGDKVSKVYVK